MRTIAGLVLLLLALPLQAAPPYLIAKCKSGTPLVTECRVKLGTGATVTKAPHVAGDGAVYCFGELGGLPAGPLAYELTPVNAWDAGPTLSGSVDTSNFQAPAGLEAATVVKTLP